MQGLLGEPSCSMLLRTKARPPSPAPQGTYRAAFREAVWGATQEVRPPSLPLHDGTGASGGLAEGAAGQLHAVILTLGHVDSTQQGLDHRPAAGGISEAWGKVTGWVHCGKDPSSLTH